MGSLYTEKFPETIMLAVITARRGGCMGRSAFVGAVLVIASIGLFVGCGNNGPGTAAPRRPAQITLTPATNLTLDLGATQTFSAALTSFTGSVITGQTVNWQSSNSAVLTISAGGMACAGTWNSLTAPTICTAGPSGIAQVTATSEGVVSPPTTVYVHPHVDNITVSLVPTFPPPTNPCISKGFKQNYQAAAFSRGVDVTADVGPFTWQSFNPTVALLSTAVSGLGLNQVQVTGNVPGDSQIYASAAGVNSAPSPVQTCLVKDISLQVAASGATSFNITQGSGVAVTPTIVDTAGNTITGLNLTYSSSVPGVATVSTGGNITTPSAGGAGVTASCTPPSCNIGTSPIQPVYSSNVISGLVTHGTTTTPSGTVWVSSTGCLNYPGCVSSILSIDTPANTPAVQVGLSSVPDSLVFAPTGGSIYLGTDKSLFNTVGLMIVNPGASPPSLNTFTSVAGKVLAISPDGSKLVLSDTADAPNIVYVVNVGSSGSITSTSFQITGAMAAAFSPDGLKAYIVAGNALYVESAIEPLQTIPLSAVPTAVSFLSQGGFAYVAGESANTVTVRKTCDDTIATDSSSIQQVISTTGTPSFMQTLPDATRVLAVTSPGISLIPVTLAAGSSDLCSATTPVISNGTASFSNLGQGNFVPTQLLVSTDGSRAYVLSSNLPTILVFDIGSQSASAIALAGNAMPIAASLSLDASTLYVGASDGLLHVIDTNSATDTAQITFPKSLCLDSSGNDFQGAACLPDLVAVRP
jgi:hypothetical protein